MKTEWEWFEGMRYIPLNPIYLDDTAPFIYNLSRKGMERLTGDPNLEPRDFGIITDLDPEDWILDESHEIMTPLMVLDLDGTLHVLRGEEEEKERKRMREHNKEFYKKVEQLRREKYEITPKFYCSVKPTV